MIACGLLKISFYFLYKLMKKNTIKAFTLVEMLIVIVIIGILIAALMPRMQAAQWRARDVSRKTALSQIQSAIVTSQWDKWRWPGCDTNGCTSGNAWMDVSQIWTEIKAAWMNSIPQDPTAWNKCTWVWDTNEANAWGGEYRYIVTKRNWATDGWFALMAKTEVEWWSNRVVCASAIDKDGWLIKSTDDISDITICTTVEKVGEGLCNGQSCRSNTWSCCYDTTDELRYLVLY